MPGLWYLYICEGNTESIEAQRSHEGGNTTLSFPTMGPLQLLTSSESLETSMDTGYTISIPRAPREPWQHHLGVL